MITESQQQLFGKLYQDLGDKIIGFLGESDIYKSRIILMVYYMAS